MTLSMHERVILVDANDQEVGSEEKLQAHLHNLKHRAFSIFVLKKTPQGTQILLHQRNSHKYHSGSLWTNTCCGHPRPSEETYQAASRRLYEEMGLSTPLQKIGVFSYEVQIHSGLWENEIDHVFVGWHDDSDFHVNPKEVMAFKWCHVRNILNDLQQTPEIFTVWLSPALSVLTLYLQTLEN